MEILLGIILISAIANLFLSIFVFLKDFSKRLNQLFGIFGFVTTIWIFLNFIFYYKGLPNLLLLRSGYAFGALVPISALLWVLELCDKKMRKMGLILSIGLLFFFFSFTNLIITNVKRVYVGGFGGDIGPFFSLYFLYIAGLLSIIVYILTATYLKTTGIKKLQIGYVLIGSIFYIAVILAVNFILPLFGILKFTALDSPSSLFLLFFTSLAITRYHLFEIRVILTEILVGVMGIILAVFSLIGPTLSPNILRFLSIFVFFLFLFFGYYLIKATHEEERRREKAEMLANEWQQLSKAENQFILSIYAHHLKILLTSRDIL